MQLFDVFFIRISNVMIVVSHFLAQLRGIIVAKVASDDPRKLREEGNRLEKGLPVIFYIRPG